MATTLGIPFSRALCIQRMHAAPLTRCTHRRHRALRPVQCQPAAVGAQVSTYLVADCSPVSLKRDGCPHWRPGLTLALM